MNGRVHGLRLRQIAARRLIGIQLVAQRRVRGIRTLRIYIVLTDLLAYRLLALAVLYLLLIHLLLELLLVRRRVEDHRAGLGNWRCRPGSGGGTGNRCRLRGLSLSQSGGRKACDAKRKRKHGKQELAR